MKTNLESISIEQLATTCGGVTARWLGNHPFAAEAFLSHHPLRDARFTANHPWMAARIQRIAG